MSTVETIREIPLEVFVELGRTAMPLSRAVGLPSGSVVELDRGAEDEVDLYVNGRLYASGPLILVDGEWALRVETVHPQPGQQVTK